MQLARSMSGGHAWVCGVSALGIPRETARFPGSVRGSIIRSLIDTYELDYGDRALGRLLADLSEEARILCLQGIMDSSWYPQQLFVELVWSIFERLGPSKCITLADRSQTRHLQRLRCLLKRGEGPSSLLPCATRAWRRYHDTGNLSIYHIAGDRALISVEKNRAVLEPGYAETVLGSLFAFVRISGATEVSGSCQRHPPGKVIFELAWTESH